VLRCGKAAMIIDDTVIWLKKALQFLHPLHALKKNPRLTDVGRDISRAGSSVKIPIKERSAQVGGDSLFYSGIL
jgi:hypothetical protein